MNQMKLQKKSNLVNCLFNFLTYLYKIIELKYKKIVYYEFLLRKISNKSKKICTFSWIKEKFNHLILKRYYQRLRYENKFLENKERMMRLIKIESNNQVSELVRVEF